MQGTDARDPTLIRSAVQRSVLASLALNSYCTKSWRCVFCGEDRMPLSSCCATSLIPSKVLLTGVADSFSCFLYFLVSEISIDKGLTNRIWILARSGELCLLLPQSLQSAAGKWIYQPLFLISGCSQTFSGKIFQFKRKLVSLPISESVWNNRSVFSQAFWLPLLNLQTWTEV